jgi:uracil-DNA glycosylase family 4
MNYSLHSSDGRILLDWYRAFGVDEAIDERPAIALRAPAAIVTPTASEISAPLASAPTLKARTSPNVSGQADALAEAMRLAESATTLEELRTAIINFTGCSLRNTAMNTVFADGNPKARIMVIGEAPDAEEDKRGIPFCGAVGELLDKMFAAIGLGRSFEAAQSLYLTPPIFWRPPGNRQPTAAEIEMCRPFVAKHIALIAPTLIVAMGATATASLLNEKRPISRLRGQILLYQGAGIAAPIATHILYHPSLLLRQPVTKRQTWNDLLQLKEAINSI